jgi:hypothetical protein
MRVLVLVGALLFAGATSAVAQTPDVQLSPSKATITITLTSVPLVHALGVVTSDFGIACEFDDSIPAEDLNRELKEVRFVNAKFKDVLSFLANQAGLTYHAVDAKTVRFEKKR